MDERRFVLSPVHMKTRLFIPQEETEGRTSVRGSGTVAQMAARPATEFLAVVCFSYLRLAWARDPSANVNLSAGDKHCGFAAS